MTLIDDIRNLLSKHLTLDAEERQMLASADDEALLLGKLTELVRRLLDNDRHRLFAAAYRMDLNEGLLQQAIRSGTSDTVALNIAALMIRREKQKAEIRKRYGKNNDNLLIND